MSSELVPAELLEARKKIDQLDQEMIELLAQRFALTYQVGLLKVSNSLTSVDAGREAQKLAELRALSEERDLNPELVVELFTRIMQEVVRNHDQLREKQPG